MLSNQEYRRAGLKSRLYHDLESESRFYAYGSILILVIVLISIIVTN